MVKIFKNVKRLKLKITSIFLITALLALEFSPLAVKATAQQLQYYSPGIVAVGYDSYNDKNVWYSNATLGGETAYCMDYTCTAPSGTMTFKTYLSDQGMAILMNGYPNVSASALGCASDDEAYMATQMALWEVLNRTGESTKAGKIFRVDNITPKSGMEDFYNRAVAAAEYLVSLAEANPYTSVPTMTIDNANVGLSYIGSDALIGPYTVTISGTDASTIKSISVSLVNAPSSAYITDANGNAKTSVSNGDTVYVRMSSSESSTSFNIKFAADVDRKVGAIYEKSGETVQDYVKIETEPVSMEKELTINWTVTTTVGKLVLTKVDQDGEPVVGATFNLSRTDGTDIGTVSTGTDGVITFYNVPAGEYILTEVSAPEGYTITEASKNVTVVAGETSYVTFTNERITGKLVITKIDDLNRPLANVTFTIYDSEGYVYDTVVTDENGKASIDLDYGTYYFKETSAPDGYTMDETLYTFSVTDENRTFYATITNEVYKGTLLIVKTDDNGDAIEGVTFNILDEDMNVISTLTTNSKGLAGLKNIPLGTYYYQEVSGPDNIIIDTGVYEFKIETDGQIVRKDIVNETVKGSLKITKTNEDGDPIANVEFNILDENKNVVEKITTNENGVAVSSELEPGTYYYKEISAPDEYVLDTTEYQFTIDSAGTLVSKTVVNYYAKGTLEITKYDSNGSTLSGVEFDILDESGNVVDHLTTDENGKATSIDLPLGTYYYKETKTLDDLILDEEAHAFVLTSNNQVVSKTVVNNYYSKGSLEITKYDSNGNLLSGVEFDILDENGTVVDHITTDENGKATSIELLLGTYYYKETAAPDNVIMDEEAHEFALTENGQVVQKTVINDINKGKLTIIKVDENDEPLAGVTFEILDLDLNVIDTMTTDENGVATSGELEQGTYYYRETEAPEGLIVDDSLHQFTIEYDGQNVIENMINYYVRGQLKIYKLVDGTTTPLAGATFEITNEAGETVETITSDENGIAQSSNLVYGTYYFKEIDAPDGYIKDENIYSFSITGDGDLIEAIVYNTEERLPQTGGLVSSDMLIVLIVAAVSICGYGIMRLLAKSEEN